MVSYTEENIMVLEPDQDRAREIAEDLNSWGVNPCIYASHFQALGKLEEKKFPLILVSMKDTGIDGLEFCRILRKRQQFGGVDFAYILLVGENRHRIRICESSDGADDFIIYPFLKCELKWRIFSGLYRYRQYEKLQSSSVYDPATMVFNEKGLKKALYQEVNRIGRKEGFLSAAVLDFSHRDWMEISLGAGLCTRVKEEVFKFLKEKLRNHDQLVRTDQDRICIISGENDLTGITGLIKRVAPLIAKMDVKQPGIKDFDLTLSGLFLTLSVQSSYADIYACAEHVHDWIKSQDSFSGGLTGYSGTLDESGIHTDGEPVHMHPQSRTGD